MRHALCGHLTTKASTKVSLRLSRERALRKNVAAYEKLVPVSCIGLCIHVQGAANKASSAHTALCLPRETKTTEGRACTRRLPFGDMLPSNSQMHSSVKPPACDASVIEVSVVIHRRPVDQLVPFWAGFTFARSAWRRKNIKGGTQPHG